MRDGYKGPLYAEISPRAFSIPVRTGSRLVKLRIRRGSPPFSDAALRRPHASTVLVELPEGDTGPDTIRSGIAFTVERSEAPQPNPHALRTSSRCRSSQ